MFSIYSNLLGDKSHACDVTFAAAQVNPVKMKSVPDSASPDPTVDLNTASGPANNVFHLNSHQSFQVSVFSQLISLLDLPPGIFTLLFTERMGSLA